jgi:hypothetical protein
MISYFKIILFQKKDGYMSHIMKDVFLKTKNLKLLAMKNSSPSITRVVCLLIFWKYEKLVLTKKMWHLKFSIIFNSIIFNMFANGLISNEDEHDLGEITISFIQ